MVEPMRIVMECAHGPALRAGVPVRHRVVVIAADAQHLFAVGGDDEAAHGVAHPAEGAVLVGHERGSRHSNHTGGLAPTVISSRTSNPKRA